MSSILNVSNHAIDLDDGRTLAPGETATDVDLDIPHNKLVVDQGLALVTEDEVPAPPAAATRKGSNS